MKVLIGIPAFRRTEQLRRLLNSLSNTLPPTGFSIIVVDNDPAGSSRAVVDEFKEQLDIYYEKELEPGVVHVRNRILARAHAYEGLAFLDDDEWVSNEWVGAISAARQQFPEAVLAGPVRYVLPESAPDRIVRGGFFTRPEHAHGAVLRTTGTGNSFFPKNVITRLGHHGFDATFARIGGEDTDLFLRLTAEGVEIRWVADAVVFESVPMEKASMVSITRGYRRNGLVNATVKASSSSTVHRVLGAAARILWGSMKYLHRRVLGKPMRPQDVATLYSGLGYLDALTGRSCTYYGVETCES